MCVREEMVLQWSTIKIGHHFVASVCNPEYISISVSKAFFLKCIKRKKSVIHFMLL